MITYSYIVAILTNSVVLYAQTVPPNGMFSPSQNQLGISNNGQTVFTINTANAVGINSSSPNSILDVYGINQQSAIVVPRDSTSNRPSGINGMLRYNITLGTFEFYQSGNWVNYAANGASNGVTSVYLGSGLLGGTITSAGTAAVDTGNTQFKIVQENTNSQITQQAGSATSPSYSFNSSLNSGFYTPGSATLAVSTNGTTRATFDSMGNLGLGTTSPSDLLEVTSQSGTASRIRVTQISQATWSLGLGANSSAFQIAQGTGPGSSFLSILGSTGFVGVGTATPSATLDINGHVANSATSLPTLSGNCGGSGSSIIGNDRRAKVTFDTNGNYSSGPCIITFAVNYSITPYCIISPFTNGSPVGIVGVNTTTTTTLQIDFSLNGRGSAPAAAGFYFLCEQ